MQSSGECYFSIGLSPGLLHLCYDYRGGEICLYDLNGRIQSTLHSLSLDEILDFYKHPAYDMAENIFDMAYNLARSVFIKPVKT